MMGHAPTVLPAVARLKLRFGHLFHVPLPARHLLLALRLGFGASEHSLRTCDLAFNAAAINLFVATVIGEAWTYRTHSDGSARVAPDIKADSRS